MLMIDCDETDADSVKEGDIVCRKHFPFKPMKVVGVFIRGHDIAIFLEAIGKNAGAKFEKNRQEFNESKYTKIRLLIRRSDV